MVICANLANVCKMQAYGEIGFNGMDIIGLTPTLRWPPGRHARPPRAAVGRLEHGGQGEGEGHRVARTSDPT